MDERASGSAAPTTGVSASTAPSGHNPATPFTVSSLGLVGIGTILLLTGDLEMLGLALLLFLVAFVVGIVAIVLAFRSRASGAEAGAATAGAVLGGVGAAVTAAIIVFILVMIAIVAAFMQMMMCLFTFGMAC